MILNMKDLDTPSLIVDLDRLEQNIKEMADPILAADVRLRPHIKTHKTPEVAQMQIQHGATGIAVAKLGEAEVMADYGFNDILIANELVGVEKIKRLAKLSQRIKIRSCVDSLAGAMMLSKVVEEGNGIPFDVLLDVNTGLNRAGCNPEQAVELGKAIAELPGINLIGVFSFAGYKLGIPDEKERRRWAIQEAETAVSISKELQTRGVEATEVSVAGTSSAVFAASVPGVTEVRPGTYVFNDMNYTRMGICSLSQCALKIRARVISRPASDRAVIDAGSKVLTTEKRVKDNDDPGYGFVEGLPGTQITALWEEHGVMQLDEDGRQLAVGDVIEIIPNHVCPTINLADVWYGVRRGVVEKEYSILARGKVR
jgi:D-serine deaminase-like pyridoxal phosphate-dependent protein